MFSGIGPGSKVWSQALEPSADNRLAHYVQPTGKVYSYDIREEGQKTARENLSRSGLSDFVELKLKDVVTGIDEGEVDAVILDLAVHGW